MEVRTPRSTLTTFEQYRRQLPECRNRTLVQDALRALLNRRANLVAPLRPGTVVVSDVVQA